MTQISHLGFLTAEAMKLCHPLSRIRDAVAELEDRRAVGKVVVVPDAEL